MVSDHTVAPSTKNATSRIAPAGVATELWFFTVADGTTTSPVAAEPGDTAVTIKSLFVTGTAVVVVVGATVVVGGATVVTGSGSVTGTLGGARGEREHSAETEHDGHAACDSTAGWRWKERCLRAYAGIDAAVKPLDHSE